MLKFLRTFALAAAMMLPFAMQAQDSWTVADGTTVHAGVPFDFYKTDASGTSFTAQMLYPATLISDMAGNTLSGITFYHNSTNSKTLSASTWTVKMGESSLSDLSAGLSTETLTTVYAGSLVFTSGIVTIEFDSPYTYTSGNLIVEISTVGASGNWIGPSSNNGFKGEDNVGYTYTTQTSPNHFAFLPKTTFTKAPSCFVATGLAVSAVTSESMTLSWTSDATSFDIYDMATHTLVGNSTTNSYIVEDLTANTSYTFGVVVDCGGGDYSDTVTVSGRTACADIETIPYTWTFEDGTANATPDCWTKVGTGTIQVRNSTTNSHNSSQYLYFSGSTSNLIVLPPTSAEANTMQMKLWLRPEGNYGSCANFSVGYITDVTDASTYTALSTFNYTEFVSGSTVAYAEKAVMFAAAPAGARMALRAEPTGTGYYWYVDDVTIEELPSCVPVSGLTVDATQTTSSSLTLTWTSDATSFVILNMADSSQVGTSSTNSYTVEGLNANTAYTFGVAVDCGGETSDTVIVNGRTACGIIASLPWNDGMEAVPSGSNQMPYCWGRYNNLTTGNNYYPYSTNSSTYAHGGNYSLYWYYSSYGTYADTAIAILPQLDVTTYPMNGNQLSFWGRMSTSTQSITVYVGTMSDPEDVTTFTTSGTVTVSGATHTRYDVNLTEANATDAYAAIMVLNPTGSASLYIDDVMLHEAPSCAYITGLTVTGATAESISLSWVDGDNTDATYSVYVVTPSDTTLVAPNIADTAYTVEDLDANTAYVFGVVANCAGGDAEMVVVNGRTACSAIELPYTETFAAAAGTRDCWTLVSNNTTNAVSSPTSSNYMGFVTYSGHDVMVFNSWSSASDYNQYGYSPLLDASTLTDADSIHVRVVYSTHGTADQLKFGYTTAASTNPTDYTWVGPFSTSGYDNWATLEANLPLDVVRLAVNYTTSSSNYKAYVDSVVVTGYTIPSCPAPTGLAVSNIGTDEATLSWTGDAGSYNVYSISGTDTLLYQTVSDTTTIISDLTAMTSYTYGVRSVCGSDSSDLRTVSFRTACSTVALPYTEDFENGIDCWTMVDCASGTNVVANDSYTTYAYTGTHAFKFAYNTNPPQYLISPELTGGEDGVQVSFMYKVGGSYTESFVLGYSTTTNETSAFTWLTEQTGLTNQTYEAYTGYLPAGTKYVAVKYTANNQLSLYIDSMVFSPMSADFCFPVTGLAVDTATGNSVTINWNGDATSYSIYNGTAYVGSTTDTFYTFNGLTASTAYTFGVTAVCSATDSADMVTIAAMTDCEGGSCTITIATGEYGLMGASIDVMQNGAIMATVTESNYDYYTENVTVCSGVPVTLVYNSGYYDDYVEFTVTDGNDSTVYTTSDASTLTDGAVFFTLNNACGSVTPQPQVEEATIDASAVTYWVGTGNNQVVMAVNWADTALAWGVNFSTDSITSQDVLDIIAANDPRFSWDTGSYGLGNITFTENGTTHTGDATHFWEGKRNTISDMGLYQNLGNGDFQKWANSAAGVVVDSMEYSGVWYYMYNYPMTIYPVTAPQPGPQPADSIVVTFATNDATLGTTTPAPGTYTYHDGDTIRFSATATTGNSFVEWIIDYGNGTTDTLDAQYYAAAFAASTMIGYGITNMTMTANFQAGVPAPDSISVTYTVNDAVMGTITPNGTIRQAVGDSLIATATANDGYRLQGWRLTTMAGGQVASDTTFSLVQPSVFFGTIPQSFATYGASVTVTAIFEAGAPDSVEVTYNVNDATMGSINPSGTVMTAVGTQISATATANAGYELYAWVFTVMLDDQVVDSDTIMTNETSYVFGSLPQTFADYNATVIITALFQQQVGIEDADIDNVNVYSANSTIYVRGAEGQSVYVFDVNGRMLNHEAKASENCDFRMENTGVYLVKVGNAAAQRVLVVR